MEVDGPPDPPSGKRLQGLGKTESQGLRSVSRGGEGTMARHPGCMGGGGWTSVTSAQKGSVVTEQPKYSLMVCIFMAQEWHY